MAEFCLDCFNKVSGSAYSSRYFHLSKEPELCEECGEWKPVIICVKRRYLVAEWFYERFSSFAGKDT